MKPYTELEVKLVINLLKHFKKVCLFEDELEEERERQYLEFDFCHIFSEDHYTSTFFGSQRLSWQNSLEDEFEMCLVCADIQFMDEYSSKNLFWGHNDNHYIFKMYETYCEIVINNYGKTEYFRFCSWRNALASYCNEKLLENTFIIRESCEESRQLFEKYVEEQKTKLNKIMKDELLSGLIIPEIKVSGYEDGGTSSIQKVMTKVSDLKLEKRIINILVEQGITHVVHMLLYIADKTKIKGISEESMNHIKSLMETFNTLEKYKAENCHMLQKNRLLNEAKFRLKYLEMSDLK